MTTTSSGAAPRLSLGGTRRTPPSTAWRPADGHAAAVCFDGLAPAPHAASALTATRAPARERRTVTAVQAYAAGGYRESRGSRTDHRSDPPGHAAPRRGRADRRRPRSRGRLLPGRP